jgi:hypothetical protein
MDRSERRRRARAERIAAHASNAATKKQEIARRKAELHQAFLDRHKLRLTLRQKIGVVLAMFFAATGGPLYWWLPDELRYNPYRRKHNSP